MRAKVWWGALVAGALAAACGGSHAGDGAAGGGPGSGGPGPGPGPTPTPTPTPAPTASPTPVPTPAGPLRAVYQQGGFRFFAVAPDGTCYGQPADGGSDQLQASADGRTWTPRGQHPAGSAFFVMTALASGTLLADVIGAGGHAISRSDDGGRTWTDVLTLGQYRMLTPGNVAELPGEVLLLEYQSFTGLTVPIRLWVSADDGRTWAVRSTTSAHRHGHGLLADPTTGALWLLFGDRTGGTYLSYDAGRTSTLVLSPLTGGVFVNAAPVAGGLLGGLDTPFGILPHVVNLSFGGRYDPRFRLPGPSYSFKAIAGGGYLAGTAHEAEGDVYPPGDESAHVFQSADGVAFAEVFACPRLDPGATARADVFWQLPGGEVVVSVLNCAGFGGRGEGYVLLSR